MLRDDSSESNWESMKRGLSMVADIEVRSFASDADDMFLHDAMGACALDLRKQYQECVYRTMFPLRFGRLSTLYILVDDNGEPIALAVFDDMGNRVLYDKDKCKAQQAKDFAESLAEVVC